MKRHLLIILLLTLLPAAGCVERLITVRSDPPGALLWLNGEEIGNTPVTVPFTWYGTYEVLLRKDGYETIRAPRRADMPLYQWPGLDLLFENLLPVDLVDHHQWDFPLARQQPTDPDALVDRARRLRAANLYPPPP